VVRREEVLWAWRVDDHEMLVRPADAWSIVTSDRKRIGSLARAAVSVARVNEAKQAAVFAELERAHGAWGGWDGWTGDGP
jgi:hypothetical protein